MRAVPAPPALLLADDDAVFCEVLGNALRRRGFAVRCAHSVAQGLECAADGVPPFAVIDLNMPGGSGLQLVEHLARAGGVHIVVLTGYASIATAVEAIKLGAVHYLAKPTDCDEVVAALRRDAGGDVAVPIAAHPMSVDRLEWEHIQTVMLRCNGNVSAAARALGMHRRTLQRKLAKRPVRQ